MQVTDPAVIAAGVALASGIVAKAVSLAFPERPEAELWRDAPPPPGKPLMPRRWGERETVASIPDSNIGSPVRPVPLDTDPAA